MDQLKVALITARDLLQFHGRQSVAAGLDDLIARIETGDVSAVTSALSEATGSMGSLRDQHLYASKDDLLDPADQERVNAKFDILVEDIERQARAELARLRG